MLFVQEHWKPHRTTSRSAPSRIVLSLRRRRSLWAAWAPNGAVAVCSGMNGTQIWHDASKKCVQSPEYVHIDCHDLTSICGAINQGGDECCILLLEKSGGLTVVRASDGSVKFSVNSIEAITGCAASMACADFGGPDHHCATFPLEDNSISMWDFSASARQPFTCTGHHARVTCLRLNSHLPLLASGDEAGTCIIWCTLQGIAMQAVPLTASITSLCFGRSGYCMAATSSFSQVIYFEQPSANDLVGLWLDDSRPVSLAQDLTKQLLQTYPNACNLKDGHGLSLLGYVAGINSMRMSKLLDCLIRYSPRKSVGLLSCTRWEGAAPEQEDMAATIDDEPSGDLQNRQGLAIDRVLLQQRKAVKAAKWDFQRTAGLAECNRVWNALELSMATDFPNKIQVLLRGMTSEVFTIASGVGIMPAVAILAAKHPKLAALAIPGAPVQPLGTFYLPRALEKDLAHVDSITHGLLKPRSIKSVWLEHEGKRRTIGLNEGSTIEVEAYVCLWPHVTTVGSAGLLHIIVKHNLDINLYGSPLVQAIIMHKWHSHARRRLLLDMGLYLLLMVLFIADLCLVGLALGRSPLEETLASDENGSNPSISTQGFAMARIEVMMFILCIRDMWVMKKRSHLTSAFRWLRKGWNSIDLVSHILLSALLIIRLLSLHMTYSAAFISMAAGCAVLLWSKVLFFMMPFATTGPLIRMMIEILWDMLPFLLVMGFLILGFSGAFYILFTPEMTAEGRGQLPSAFANFQRSLLSTFLMILGSFDIEVFQESTPHSDMAIFMFCLYQVLGMIVLLNLLIAIMGDTFDRVRDREALHFWKGRAAVIDEIELASQMDSNVFNTGAGKEKQYLPPHLHTLKATETAQLEKILETDKQQELKDRIEQLEQTIASGIEKFSVEIAKLQRVQDHQAEQLPRHSAGDEEREASMREASTHEASTQATSPREVSRTPSTTMPPEEEYESQKESTPHEEEQQIPEQWSYDQPDEDPGQYETLALQMPLPSESSPSLDFGTVRKIRRTAY